MYVYLVTQVLSDSATSWTVTCQAPLSIGFPRQEYWSELLFTSLGDLPDTGIEPMSPALADEFFSSEPPRKQRDCKLHSGFKESDIESH